MTNSNAASRAFFDDQIIALRKRITAIKKKANVLSWLRVFVFLSFAFLLLALMNAGEAQWMLLSLMLFIPAFGVIVTKHNNAKFSLAQNLYLLLINKTEINRSEGDFFGLDKGQEFSDVQHAYAPDLDLFGSNSLFQLLVRSKLSGTRVMFENWLKNKASKNDIEERQIAIQELVQDPTWRQNLTAFGYHGNQQDKKYANVVSSLIQWLDDNFNLLNSPFWHIVRYLMPLASVFVIVGVTLLQWPYQWIYLPVLINLALLSILFKPLMEITKEFGNIDSFLKGYENLILAIESKKFSAPLLIRLHEQLKKENISASASLKSLRNILMFLLNRVNLLYIPFNILFLLDVNWLLSAVRWKKKNIHLVDGWFAAVHQIDALNDTASYAFVNPDFAFPTITLEEHHLVAEEMGHPLIKPASRVSNDFSHSGKGSLGLVTGSNMSGKSTFLRTIGVNLVLAQLGAPVCAKKFETSLVRVFTSMRTQDNLEESVSSFYAELARLKKLLDLLDEEEPVFYMLDEILKGTNSDDRHKGALSLIDQLIEKNCRGLVSTHDIQLSKLSKDQSRVQNMSFNNTIVEDEIFFDYKLSLSPCASFNASKLMEKMGIIKK